MITVRNWREQEPYLGHYSVLIWPLFREASAENPTPPEIARLQTMSGFVKHALQGRKRSDYHHHDHIEQMYYILRGRGRLVIGEDIHEVQEGDAVYMPVHVPHQAFNDGEAWMEHLIVSCPLQDIEEGTVAVRNWRDAIPSIADHKAVVWPLLSRRGTVAAEEGGVLQRMHSVTRQMLQGRSATAPHRLDGIEQVYYVLSGHARVTVDESAHIATEGSAVYVPPGVSHQITNESESWFEYVVFAAGVDAE